MDNTGSPATPTCRRRATFKPARRRASGPPSATQPGVGFLTRTTLIQLHPPTFRVCRSADHADASCRGTWVRMQGEVW